MAPSRRLPGWLARLNGRGHRAAMLSFAAIVVAHWAEHIAQAAQVWLMHMPRHQAHGALGQWFPWLARSEWLHYVYALVMLAALLLLRPGMAGSARRWWDAALAIQVWHHFEHALLLAQAVAGASIAGPGEPPTSILQLVTPRMELHLAYNAAVTLPMVIAMALHAWRPAADPTLGCTCSARSRHDAAAPGPAS